LLRHDEYRRLTGDEPGIRELLAFPPVEEIDFEPARLGEGITRPVDFA
jgi:hypothetical protein